MIITLIAMAFSAFFSGMEIAFITSDKVRVSVDTQKGGLTGRIIDTFYKRQDMFISTMLVGNNIMLVIYGMGIAVLLEPAIRMFTDNTALILICQTIISTGLILITGEFFPKTIFRINPNISLRHCAIPLYLIYWILYPISWFASAVSKLIMRIFGAQASEARSPLLTVSELDDYLQKNIDEKAEGENKEVIEHEVKFFRNALDFSKTLLRDCMVPRNEIVAVDADETNRRKLRQRFTATGLSKIIVYREDIDNVLGYIHINELFSGDENWQSHIKEVVYAPESMQANMMMKKMLAEKRSMAVVVDEFGGTGGLVTLEDLVEEIFGDFEDEHDKRRIVEMQLSETSYKFSGRIEIEHINEKYPLDIPEDEEYQTLAGYLLYTIGQLPKQGESITVGNLKYTILKKSANRIELVRVDLLSPASK